MSSSTSRRAISENISTIASSEISPVAYCRHEICLHRLCRVGQRRDECAEAVDYSSNKSLTVSVKPGIRSFMSITSLTPYVRGS